jgi:hypothetical protein
MRWHLHAALMALTTLLVAARADAQVGHGNGQPATPVTGPTLVSRDDNLPGTPPPNAPTKENTAQLEEPDTAGRPASQAQQALFGAQQQLTQLQQNMDTLRAA